MTQPETQGLRGVITGQTAGCPLSGDPQWGISEEHIQVLMKSTPDKNASAIARGELC